MKKEGFGYWIIIIDNECRLWEHPKLDFYDGGYEKHTQIMDSMEFKLANPEKFVRLRMVWWYDDGEIRVGDLETFWGFDKGSDWYNGAYWNEYCKEVCKNKVKKLVGIK